MRRLLVLWDIDHTLLDAGDVGREAYAAAFLTATGLSLRRPWRFDGRTERAAVTDELREHGLDPNDAMLAHFAGLLVAEFRHRTVDMVAGGRVLPGVVAAVAALATLPGVHQSVLTGNLYEMAELKLAAFGLTPHLDLRLGAYGNDAYERTDLARFALARAQRHLGGRYDGSDAVIIGDTPRDVATARAVGARAIAVATGTTTLAELVAAGADVVLPDLTDTAAVVRAVSGAGATA